MNVATNIRRGLGVVGLAVAAILLWTPAFGTVQGVQDLTANPVFNLTTGTGHILTSDGDRFLMWMYDVVGDAQGVGPQYPGPTLIVMQNSVVTVNLVNNLPFSTSIVFPGQTVTAAGGTRGVLAREAPPDGVTQVSYTFTASQPGTYLYRSGTDAGLQVEMGLVGMLIVRPAGYVSANPNTWTAYNHPDTQYDREVSLLLTEMDPRIHRLVEFGQYDQIDFTTYFATNWFINGRNFPDDMAENYVPWLPTQPYNFVPRINPGDRILVRSAGGGVDMHPFHYHGNDFEVIAADARMLSSGPGNGPDLAWQATTRRSIPGQTVDVMWTWTGEKLGWDIYAHDPADPANPGCNDGNGDNFDDVTFEYCPDHNIPFPVILPPRDAVTNGQFYSGSPFLGTAGALPPGEGGFNVNAGFFYMWHSHTEKELTSNDIWPGGLVSFMIVEPPSVVIPE